MPVNLLANKTQAEAEYVAPMVAAASGSSNDGGTTGTDHDTQAAPKVHTWHAYHDESDESAPLVARPIRGILPAEH